VQDEMNQEESEQDDVEVNTMSEHSQLVSLLIYVR